MDILKTIRLTQTHQQGRAIAASGMQPLATYQSRDPVTGDRLLEGADGSKIRAEYRGIAELPDRPNLTHSNAIGLLGYIP
jgi:hypothetical protein